MLINEICAYLKNWFDENDDKMPLPSWRGEFTITDGSIDLSGKLLDGQFFRIQNSILNDGVYQYPAAGLRDETFNGKIQAMAVPQDLISLMGEMAAWMEKNGTADSAAMSPFNSESFGGYSYSKSVGYAEEKQTGNPIWAQAYGGRLARWRKI